MGMEIELPELFPRMVFPCQGLDLLVAGGMEGSCCTIICAEIVVERERTSSLGAVNMTLS